VNSSQVDLIFNAWHTSLWKRSEPTRNGQDPIDGLNFLSGKAGS
jgi:hypothetical protein